MSSGLLDQHEHMDTWTHGHMLRVGLTGGIGSGKSVVARMFGVLGIPVFSSDEAGRHLLQDDADVRARVIAAFGTEVYPEGRIDRKALAGRVFNDGAALAKLNAIVHPAVRKAFSAWADAQQASYVVNEAAILIESGAAAHMDHLVVVSAPEGERLARVMKRDRIDRGAGACPHAQPIG
ncbi:MAG: dephospho-CoA kinase [Flavobacteriales bacterium]